MKINEQTPRQRNSLMQTLILGLKGQIHDGITLQRFMQETYGLYEDWHVWSMYLDYLTRIECAEFVEFGNDRQERYLIK